MNAFLQEMAKKAYAKPTHRRLMSKTVRTAFGSDVSKDARGLMLDGSVEADKGLRHPWLPWNDAQHAFPSVTKKEFRRENRIMHNDALKSLSRAIADEDIGKMRRNTLMTQGLLGVGHVQHAQMDLQAHYNKPLEMAEKSGDKSAIRDMKRLRKVMRGLPGYYGGMVASAAEHVNAGLRGTSSQLDRLRPSKFKSDHATAENAEAYGHTLRKTLVKKIKKDYKKSGAEAEELVRKRLKKFKPTTIERAAGRLLDAGQHGVQQVQRLGRLPDAMSDRQRYVLDSAKKLMRGVIGG